MNEKQIAIAFAEFLDEDCIRCVSGWSLAEWLDEYIETEFELDELYDFWREKILTPNP